MENNHDIDIKFNEASKADDEPETFPSFEKVWEKIEEKLDKKESKKIIPIWLPYGIAACLIIGFGAFYIIDNKNGKTDISNTEIVLAKDNASVSDKNALQSGNIQKIDSTIKSNIEKAIQTPPVVSAPIAYVEVVSPTPSCKLPQALDLHENDDNVETPKKDDTLNIKNIEEVIAKGIKRDKASIMNSTPVITSYDGRTSNINSVTDTAEVIPPTPFDRQEPIVVLGYGKAPTKSKYIAKNMANGKIAGKPFSGFSQDAVSGLAVNSLSGSSGYIAIRGAGSVKADETSLYIIDGEISDADTFKKLDPDKIVAVTVLKKAALTVLYGSKAANGVIVIETKDISKSGKKKLEEIIKAGSQEKKPEP